MLLLPGCLHPRCRSAPFYSIPGECRNAKPCLQGRRAVRVPATLLRGPPFLQLGEHIKPRPARHSDMSSLCLATLKQRAHGSSDPPTTKLSRPVPGLVPWDQSHRCIRLEKINFRTRKSPSLSSGCKQRCTRIQHPISHGLKH